MAELETTARKPGDSLKVLEGRQIRWMAHAAIMAALTAAGAWIAVPVGPVPIVLQNLFIYLTGLLLGSRWGTISVSVYLLAGACGLPVFAGAVGGIGRIFGPTGGYLVGYLPAVFIVGRITERKQSTVWAVAAMILATVVVYTFGVGWLHLLTAMSWQKSLAVGMLPFLPGDALKIAAAAVIARSLGPLVKRG